MIKYEKDAHPPIPTSDIKIIGLGGAGANIIERVSTDGLQGPEILAVNADLRTLEASTCSEKIQLGAHVTRGLGCGGDPEIGKRAAIESANDIRASIRGCKIVFLCVGLGGGTGSGAAPIITRIAKEEQAFTVVFATMPFAFEGTRRQVQAETALNELAALADALVTFDNGRMADLVLEKSGIHDAFSAADLLISESIHAISRIALHPGIVHIGLDDLVTALSSNRSRCLFGSGRATGSERVFNALGKALESPLLDQGMLLNTAETILIHICGGSSLTMHEADKMMTELHKSLNPSAQIFFGISIDDTMGEEFSVTIISSLPEEDVVLKLAEEMNLETLANKEHFETPLQSSPTQKVLASSESALPLSHNLPEQVIESLPTQPLERNDEPSSHSINDKVAPEPTIPPSELITPEEEYNSEDSHLVIAPTIDEVKEPSVRTFASDDLDLSTPQQHSATDFIPKTSAPETTHSIEREPLVKGFEESATEAYIPPPLEERQETLKPQETLKVEEPIHEEVLEKKPKPLFSNPVKRRFAHLFEKKAPPAEVAPESSDFQTKSRKFLSLFESHSSHKDTEVQPTAAPAPDYSSAAPSSPPLYSQSPAGMGTKSEIPKIEPEDNLFSSQGDLQFFGRSKGRFEGEDPNVYDGEDLDIPTFLREPT